MLIVRILGLAYFYKGTLIRVLDFVQIIARPTLLSLLGVIVICAFDWVNGSGVLSHVLSLFGKSILFLFCYFLGDIICFRCETIHIIKSFIRKVI